MTPRLTSKFWLDAYRLRLSQSDIPAFVTARGDETAGAILIKLNLLDGQARLFQRGYDMDFNRVWSILAEGEEAVVDQSIGAQKKMDPDLWVLEIEDRAGRHLLDEDGLEA